MGFRVLVFSQPQLWLVTLPQQNGYHGLQPTISKNPNFWGHLVNGYVTVYLGYSPCPNWKLYRESSSSHLKPQYTTLLPSPEPRDSESPNATRPRHETNMAELLLILKVYRSRNKAAVHEPTVTNANSHMNHAQSRYINHPDEKYGYSIREIQPCQVVKAFFCLSTILSPGSAAGAAALKLKSVGI